ncbi:MAG TPA: hypothetical protein PK563_15485 [Tenuifilaceae bacterium]|nr:hypothetical protein [Tenuifilaceae bacterium]
MKKLILLFTLPLLSIFHTFSQDINIYLVKENVETVIKNTELLISDPFILESTVDLPGVFELRNITGIGVNEEADVTTGALKNLNIYIETAVTPTSKYLQLPIRYKIGDFSLSMSIPFFYHRALEYSHGRESTTGLGDLQLDANYEFKKNKIFTEFKVKAKLPTGDANKQVDGYLVPLGTGSTDFQIRNFFLYEEEKYSIFSNLGCRINGSSSRIVEIVYPENNDIETIEYSISNGNTFSANTAFRYKLGYDFSIMTGFSAIANSQGKVSHTHSYSWDKPLAEFLDENACQNFLYVDMNLGLAYTIFKFDFVLNVRPPLYTKRSEGNVEGKRSLSYFLRVSRRLL